LHKRIIKVFLIPLAKSCIKYVSVKDTQYLKQPLFQFIMLHKSGDTSLLMVAHT